MSDHTDRACGRRFPLHRVVNFAYTAEAGRIAFYVHGAMAGKKYELMRQNARCSFEMDIPLKLDCLYEKKDVTMRYKSVMGAVAIDLP